MDELRNILGVNYPQSFGYKKAGDAHSFLMLMHQLLESQISVNDAFKISYIMTTHGEHNEFELQEKDSYFLSVSMDKIIPKLELREKQQSDVLKSDLKGSFITFVKWILNYTPESQLTAISQAWSGRELPRSNRSLNLAGRPPKMLTFYLQYEEYFDNVTLSESLAATKSPSETFVTRPHLMNILSEVC